MLYVRKLLFHIIVYILGNVVRFHQFDISVHCYFKIHIDLISELSGLKQIDAYDSGLLFDIVPKPVFQILAA